MSTIDGKPSRARVSRETSGGRASSRATSLGIQLPASSSPGATTDQPSPASSGTGLPSSHSGSRPAPRNATDAPCGASRTAVATKPHARSQTSSLIGRGCRQLNIERPLSPMNAANSPQGRPESGRRRRSPPTEHISNRRKRLHDVFRVRRSGERSPLSRGVQRDTDLCGICRPSGRGFLWQSFNRPRRPIIAMRRPGTSPSCANTGGGRVLQGRRLRASESAVTRMDWRNGAAPPRGAVRATQPAGGSPAMWARPSDRDVTHCVSCGGRHERFT